jgi:hypothetical protein
VLNDTIREIRNTYLRQAGNAVFISILPVAMGYAMRGPRIVLAAFAVSWIAFVYCFIKEFHTRRIWLDVLKMQSEMPALPAPAPELPLIKED